MPQKRNFLALVILAITTFAFFLPLFLSHLTFGYGDIHRYFYPIRSFSANCIKDGFLPLWNPYLLSGYPNLAALQSNVFYPLSLFTYLFPFHLGFKLFIVSHFFLASYLTYLLMRNWGLSWSASLISGLTYGFGGYLLSVVDMLTTLSSATWTPLIFLFFTQALNSGRLRYPLLTAVALLLQFLGGEPTVLYLSLIVMSVMTLFRVLTDVSFKPILFLFLSGLLGLGLVLFQAWPFWEMVSWSGRASGLSYRHVVSLALSPIEILNLLFPFFSGNFVQNNHFWFGQSWLESIYCGILPIFLVVLAVLKARKLLVWFWIIVLLGSLAFCIGDLFPAYHFCYHFLPGFKLIRYPVKFFSYAAFSLSLLAGFGYDCLLKSVGEKRSKQLFLISLLAGIYLLIWGIGLFKEEELLNLIKTSYFPAYSNTVLSDWYEQLFQHILIVGLILSSIGLSLYLIKRRLVGVNVLSFCLISILLTDLFIFGFKINPLLPQELYSNQPASLRFIQQDKSCYRVCLDTQTERFFRVIRGRSLKEALIGVQGFLVPNFGLLHNLFDAGGYESLTLNDYNRFFKEAEKNPSLLNLINVKYIISHQPLNRDGLRLVFHQQGVYIYHNLHFLPRAFLVNKVKVIKERNEILKRLSSHYFDPLKEVILEEDVYFELSGLKFKMPGVQIVEYQPNRVILETSSQADAFLFLSDSYYPGWKAYVDGKKTKIYRANFAFRSILVVKGKHRIEFVYSPLSFQLGLMLSGLVLLSVIIVWRLRAGN